jgi:hypothetical protein
MKFDELNRLVPYVVGGKPKVLEMHPYNAITLRMPGKHQGDTNPKGGDFVVCVDDETLDWTEHQFSHIDIFNDLDVKLKNKYLNKEPFRFAEHYSAVVRGMDPDKIDIDPFSDMPGLHPRTFFHAVQCLALAEHRRYHQHEEKFGGRYLPLRFACGIVEGRWTAAQAAEKQKMGRPGVEWLEKDYGLPDLTKELLNA